MVTLASGATLNEAMSRGYCCFRSVLCLSHYLVPLPIYNVLRQSYEEDIKQIASGSTNHALIFLVILLGIELKREKVGPTFSSFKPCPFLPSVATYGRKQVQCLNKVLNNKTGPFF